MMRDIAMIISVMISIVSVGFGVYKNIEAGNNRAFIYEQAYDIIGAIQWSDISDQAKSSITNEALSRIGAPPPVIDLSQSSADVGPSAGGDTGPCSFQQEQRCAGLADDLGRENLACSRSKEPTGPMCAQASRTRALILNEDCHLCFTQ